MSNLYDWSHNPDGNSDADDLITWREGMMPSQVNNSARAMMKRLRDNAYDRLFCREPVVGKTNLRVTLEEDFKDYVDGMIVRFRCPNDIGEVPDKALLCVTNIPVNKRGNDGDGLPMVMLSWNLEEKGLRVKRATGDMFVSGSHITAVYSSIHHIWEDEAYEEEQKAEKHLRGDTMALLKTDAEWQKYADDLGVFFIYTDSNMAEIQRMIEGNIEDTLYGCTDFPKMNHDDYTSPIIPLAIAKKVCKEEDKECEEDCMVIVQNPASSRRIVFANEGSVWNDGIQRNVPDLNDKDIYTVRSMADLLRPHQEGEENDKFCRYIYKYIDMDKLNKCKYFQLDFETKQDDVLIDAVVGLNVSLRSNGIMDASNYLIIVVDEIIQLPNDGLLTPAVLGINNALTSITNYKVNLMNVYKKGKHHLDAFVLPINEYGMGKAPSLRATGGKGEFGEFYLSGISIEHRLQ